MAEQQIGGIVHRDAVDGEPRVYDVDLLRNGTVRVPGTVLQAAGINFINHEAALVQVTVATPVPDELIWGQNAHSLDLVARVEKVTTT